MKKNRFFLAIVMLVLAFTLTLSPAVVLAEDDPANGLDKKDKYLKPNSTCNISDYDNYGDNNTTFHINKAGEYRLKGYSDNVRFEIESGNVQIVLADSFELKPGAYANVGKGTAGFDIENGIGTVTFISEAGAGSTIGGYMDAGIKISGTKTKVVFKTEDPSNPGMISVHGGYASAGIGSNNRLMQGTSVGNIYIESGNVNAEGGYPGGAGIGGGSGVDCNGVYITGGYVHAQGAKYAAGIGGGFDGHGKNISIKNAEVHAIGGPEGGAGIGGGGSSSTECIDENRDGINITIESGDVHAVTNSSCAAIGGGTKGDGKNIVINGGTVYAESAGTGPAIGGSFQNAQSGALDLTINGGEITAVGNESAPGIGSSIYKKNGQGPSKIKITGGTVTSKGGKNADYDIAGRPDSTVIITGGTLKADRINVTPTDSKGKTVYKTDIQLEDCEDHQKIDSAVIQGLNSSYGLKDVYTMGSRLYFWLPKTAQVKEVTDDSEVTYMEHEEKIVIGKGGKLAAPVRFTLSHGEFQGAYDGSAVGVFGRTELKNFKGVTPPEEFHVAGYIYKDRKVYVADGEGNLLPDTYWTDSDGKFKYVTGKDTLEALYEPDKYTIKFDSNKPDEAQSRITGIMSDVQRACGKDYFYIPGNVYELPGWIFTEWNTKADGTGRALAAGDFVSGSLSDKHGDVVKLYAQWKRGTYEIALVPGDGTGEAEIITAEYDTAVTLPAVESLGFAKENSHFAGWHRSILGGTFYPDGAAVTNLTGYENSLVTLTASWMTAGGITVYTALDDELKDLGGIVSQSKIILKGKSSGITYEIPKTNTGTYQTTESLAAGEYELYIVKSDGSGEIQITDLNIEDGGTVVQHIRYYTVDKNVSDPDHARFSGAASADGIYGIGAKIRLELELSEGYKFARYTASGTVPEWENGDPAKNPQDAEVTGKTTITGNVSPIEYEIQFVPNGGTGQIMPSQEMIYDREDNLHGNIYFREGYTFAGWNTEADGTGEGYDDKAAVKNLTAKDGGISKLYAQWNANTYWVMFDANDMVSGAMKQQEMIYDTAEKLDKNAFQLEHYHFTGWNTEPGGTGTAFADGEEVKNLTSEAKGLVILYAQWERDVYTVVYDANGGTGEMISEEVFGGDQHAAPESLFTREGFVFKGWNTKANGTGQMIKEGEYFSDLAGHGKTVTLYAQWKSVGPDPYKTGDDSNLPWAAAAAALIVMMGAVFYRRVR